MIWLVKTREKAISDGAKNLYVYLKDCMEPAEKYIKHIKSKKLTPDILKDTEFHLYQLMEIYVSCKIVARWLCLKTKSEQLDFFHHLTDVRDLKEICDFSDSYCSQFEYNSFSNQMRKTIAALYDENINDVKKAFRDKGIDFKNETDAYSPAMKGIGSVRINETMLSLMTAASTEENWKKRNSK